jgi:hypothetical protein
MYQSAMMQANALAGAAQSRERERESAMLK